MSGFDSTYLYEQLFSLKNFTCKRHIDRYLEDARE
jgi:hypothetical protein